MQFFNFSKTAQSHGLQTINISEDAIKKCSELNLPWYFISLDEDYTLRCFSMYIPEFLEYDTKYEIGRKYNNFYIVYLDPKEGELFSESKKTRSPIDVYINKIIEIPESGDIGSNEAINNIQKIFPSIQLSYSKKIASSKNMPSASLSPQKSIKIINSQAFTLHETHWLNIPELSLIRAIQKKVKVSIICYDGNKRSLKCYRLDPTIFLGVNERHPITQMGETGKFSVYLYPKDSCLYRGQNPIASEKIMEIELSATLENF